MTRTNEAHTLVLESLTEALLQLMEHKPLREISISELCQKAGVSRVSFYRNYSSMDDILIQQLNRCTDAWWGTFSQKEPDDFFREFWSSLLGEYRKNERLIRLLYKNDLSYILMEHIRECVCNSGTGEELDSYVRSALAGALFGLVNEWIKRGMGSFPDNFRLTGTEQGQQLGLVFY
ncbi:MAG: TetR/AcrR family transcriptional regulator [Lachnospiraceae bacterium]|nr:TetR/AcrR family transcriptional regulator [Lachnospiraceae bacterium]